MEWVGTDMQGPPSRASSRTRTMVTKRSLGLAAAALLLGLFVLASRTGTNLGPFSSMQNPGDQQQQGNQPKNNWPELVGKSFEEAKHKVQKEAPDVTVGIIILMWINEDM